MFDIIIVEFPFEIEMIFDLSFLCLSVSCALLKWFRLVRCDSGAVCMCVGKVYFGRIRFDL